MKNRRNAFAISAVLLASLSTSFAQYGGGMGGGFGRMGGGARGRSMDGTGTARSTEAVSLPGGRINQTADRLYDLRMRIVIETQQAPAWDEFYAKAMAWAGEAWRGKSAASDQGAVQALQQRLTEAQNRYALMESLADATKKLYAVLSLDQQRIADQYLPPTIP